MRQYIATAFLLTSTLLTGCLMQPVYRVSADPVKTVSQVDLQKYLGKWYEIYRLPNWFEDTDCITVTAEYSPLPDNQISVLNSCQKQDKLKQAHGIAKIADTQTNAKLKVSFFRPFYGDYWILDLASDYSWVLVGEPSGKYFWILARDRHLPPQLEEQLLQKAERLGYLRKDLIRPSNQL
jgi:apolipoprotein D and lipocalin family protein